MSTGKSQVSAYDEGRLSAERESYQSWMDRRADEVFLIAEEAKAKGLDFEDFVEIPRTKDLASRTEKLLEESGRVLPTQLRQLHLPGDPQLVRDHRGRRPISESA